MNAIENYFAIAERFRRELAMQRHKDVMLAREINGIRDV